LSFPALEFRVKLVRVFPTIVAVVASVGLAAIGAGCNNTTSPSLPTPTFTVTDLALGSGADALTGSSVTMNYTGWLYDASKPEQKGLQFDTSTGRGPFTFTLGAGQVIPGWDQGIAGMKVGGARRLIIPPSLGYGSSRNGPIPPNSSLVFDVELVSVQ
jgi:FKBP-type peptidyl-prolyl cis-trans isomerase FkpA